MTAFFAWLLAMLAGLGLFGPSFDPSSSSADEPVMMAPAPTGGQSPTRVRNGEDIYNGF